MVDKSCTNLYQIRSIQCNTSIRNIYQNGDYDHGKFDSNNEDTVRDNKERDTTRKDEDNGNGGDEIRVYQNRGYDRSTQESIKLEKTKKLKE